MCRIRLLFVAALLCGCSLPKGETDDRRPEPGEAIVRAGDLPAGTIHRTSRNSDFEEMCKDLAKANVVYVGESTGNTAERALELQIIRQLHAQTRLDAIGLAALGRPSQPALDEYARGRIDWAQLTARIESDTLIGYREILEFAQKHRLGLVALDVDRSLRAIVLNKGRAGLTDEQQRALPAQSDAIDGYDEFMRETAKLVAAANGDNAENYLEALRMSDAVLADSVVRWLRASPKDAQLAVLARRNMVAFPWGMATRVRARSGRTHLSVVLLDKAPQPSQLARSYADFVFVPGE